MFLFIFVLCVFGVIQLFGKVNWFQTAYELVQLQVLHHGSSEKVKTAGNSISAHASFGTVKVKWCKN